MLYIIGLMICVVTGVVLEQQVKKGKLEKKSLVYLLVRFVLVIIPFLGIASSYFYWHTDTLIEWLICSALTSLCFVLILLIDYYGEKEWIQFGLSGAIVLFWFSNMTINYFMLTTNRTLFYLILSITLLINVGKEMENHKTLKIAIGVLVLLLTIGGDIYLNVNDMVEAKVIRVVKVYMEEEGIPYSEDSLISIVAGSKRNAEIQVLVYLKPETYDLAGIYELRYMNEAVISAEEIVYD